MKLSKWIRERLLTSCQVTRKPNRIRLLVESLEDRCVPANHAPIGTAATLTIPQNQAYTIATSDFGFTDPNDSPANNFSAVTITTFPTAGHLDNNGMPVGTGTSVSVADIVANHLVYSPDLMGSGSASLTFQVQENGGVGIDPNPKVMTFTSTTNNQNTPTIQFQSYAIDAINSDARLFTQDTDSPGPVIDLSVVVTAPSVSSPLKNAS